MMIWQVYFLVALSEDHIFHPQKYWTESSNIVATVSAYERKTRLQSGELISYYSTFIDNQCTNYSAILFYVVNPQEHAGKYFRLEAIEQETNSGYLPPAYEFGKLYYWNGIVSNDLVTFPVPTAGRMNVGKTCGNIYYHSHMDAVRALRDLENERIIVVKQMNSISNQLEIAKADGIDVKNDPQYRRLRGRYFDLKMGCLPSNEYKQEEVKMQIKNLKEIEQTRSSNEVDK